jgi:phospholipase C
MAETTRRQFVGAAAGAAALSLLPRSLHEAMAQPMRPGGLKAIEHVVILMQENRSFDHYFGTMRGVRGFGDRAPLTIRSGRSIFAQPKPGGGEVLRSRCARPPSARAAPARTSSTSAISTTASRAARPPGPRAGTTVGSRPRRRRR